jgi:pyruvate,water dikinase
MRDEMMAEVLCFPFEVLTKERINLVGGKAANLGELVRAGFPVPPGFVISANAFAGFMESSGLTHEVAKVLAEIDRGDSSQLRVAEEKLRGFVESNEISKKLKDEILIHYKALGNGIRVAVRSSATAEDLACASFAGQQDTCLNIIGELDLLKAIRHCWSSLFTAQAIYYRCRKGFDDIKVKMAVVVQQMVDSEKSGVIFTIDPVSRNPYQMLVEAVWGLGEGIVSGKITPDHYKIDRETFEILFKFIAKKTEMYSMDSHPGVCLMEVPPAKVETPVLNEDELHRLVDLGNQVEKHYRYPQDIEWCIDRNRIYLLQSRPITNL